MVYNENLAQVIRESTGMIKSVVEKKMFGGIAFMVNGNMAVGVHKDNLVIRVNKDSHDEFLKRPHIKEFDITGRKMKGWLMLLPEGHSDQKALSNWIKEGIEFAKSLPPK